MAVKMEFEPGHFYSPIVDSESARAQHNKRRRDRLEDIAGIDIDDEEMCNFWRSSCDFMRCCDFPDDPDGIHRYHFKCGFYGWGDGLLLRAMINVKRPKKIIEIGSGFSTACMLDVAEEIGLNFDLISIEPYQQSRIKSLLRVGDWKRVQLLETPIQEVPLEIFKKLEPNDIVFIDSSHVLKTGSDVQQELFYILPALPAGVMIHFHDIFFPFEYPDEFVYRRNFSWNELYAVRAFLMYNDAFSIKFFNDYFAANHRELIAMTCPQFLKNPGGALWIEKVP